MADDARGPLTVRVALSATTFGLAVAAALGIVATWTVLVSARAVVATALGAAIAAVLLTGPVEWLRPKTGRAAAILITLAVVAGAGGGVAWAVFDDLDSAFERLQEVAPQAARDLERSERVGEIARDVKLAERVEAAVDRIRAGARERAREAAFRAASYFVFAILSVFLVIYGPRMIEGGVGLVRDPGRREQVRRMVESTLSRSRRYLSGVIAQGLAVTVVSVVAFRVAGLPASLALGGVVGLASVVPYLGIAAGFVPALLLGAAFEAGTTTIVLSVLALGLQVGSIWVTRVLSRRAMYAGPALTLIALLVGWELYGPGGAVFGLGLIVFTIAVAEAAAADRPREAVPA